MYFETEYDGVNYERFPAMSLLEFLNYSRRHYNFVSELEKKKNAPDIDFCAKSAIELYLFETEEYVKKVERFQYDLLDYEIVYLESI